MASFSLYADMRLIEERESDDLKGSLLEFCRDVSALVAGIADPYQELTLTLRIARTDYDRDSGFLVAESQLSVLLSNSVALNVVFTGPWD